MINSTPVFIENTGPRLHEWRMRYEDLGLGTIPLIGKSPVNRVSWKEISPHDQWLQLTPDFRGNIGIVTGSGISVIDADNNETAIAIENGLKSMGLFPATVSTPHGKHFYLKVANSPQELNWSRLANQVYQGELRVRNSYVVAPCSLVDGIPYRWERGKPEDLRSQAVVQWRDLLWLLPKQSAAPLIKNLPIRLLYRDMPRKARNILEQLQNAVKGQNIEKYQSRSDAEAAVITMLILAGWSYDQTLTTFMEWSPGKYYEARGKDQQAYFDRTYYRALSAVAAHPTRREIAGVWQAAQDDPYWPGGSGYLQRDTYLGLLAICWQFGSWQVSASERDLAEYSAASQAGIHRALDGLARHKHIERRNLDRNVAEPASWRVTPLRSVSSQVMTYDALLREDTPNLIELWSPTKLGRTAGTVYYLLGHFPVSVGELARQTGKAWGTVKAALRRLEGFDLATRLDSGWVLGKGNLTDVALQFETSNAAFRRRSYHKRQREVFTESLVRRQNKDESQRY